MNTPTHAQVRAVVAELTSDPAEIVGALQALDSAGHAALEHEFVKAFTSGEWQAYNELARSLVVARLNRTASRIASRQMQQPQDRSQAA